MLLIRVLLLELLLRRLGTHLLVIWVLSDLAWCLLKLLLSRLLNCLLRRRCWVVEHGHNTRLVHASLLCLQLLWLLLLISIWVLRHRLTLLLLAVWVALLSLLLLEEWVTLLHLRLLNLLLRLPKWVQC